MLRFVQAYMFTNTLMALISFMMVAIREYAHGKRTGDFTRSARLSTYMYVNHWWLCMDSFLVNALIVIGMGAVASTVALNAYYNFLDYEESLILEEEGE